CYEAAHCRLCSSVRRGVAVARLLPKTTAVISRRENVILIAFCKTVSLNHNPIYGSKEPFLMTNSIYLKPFDRVRSNHPFWAWPFRTIMIHSSKANTGASSALSLAAKAQEGVLSA